MMRKLLVAVFFVLGSVATSAAQCNNGITGCPAASSVNASDYTVLAQQGGTGPTGYVTRKATVAQFATQIATSLFSNPTAVIGLSPINGIATTAIRSDAAPALSQSIAPTWSSLHTFAAGLVASGGEIIAQAGQVSSRGPSAALNFQDRTSAGFTPTWTWYAVGGGTSSRARLFNGSVDVLQVTQPGNVILPQGGIQLLPPANSLTQALISFQTTNGTNTVAGVTSAYAFGYPMMATVGAPAFLYNQIWIDDQLAVTGAGNIETGGLSVGMTMGGANSQGGKRALSVQLFANRPGANPSQGRDRVSAEFGAYDAVGDGGTNTGAGARGSLFAGSFGSTLLSGATNVFILSGAEVDIGIKSGASAARRVGWTVVDWGDIQAAGAYDLGYNISALAGSPGFKGGYIISQNNGGFGVSAGGTLVGTDALAQASFNGIGVDWSYVDFNTGFAFKGGYTHGGTAGVANFTVNGAGEIVGAKLTVNGQILQVGSGSGTITLQTQAAAGTFNWNWPTTAGSSGNCLLSAGGVSSPMTWGACLTSTPAALTKTDDTNVTVTLGGTPATALLQAVSMTLGWTGTLAAGRLNANVVQGVTNDTNVTGTISAQVLTLGWTGTLAVARGGIGVGTLAANGVLYGNGTGAVLALAVNAGAKLFLTQTSSAAPAWAAIAAGDLPGSFSGFANPTASIGLTAVNGAATTAMRSDAAPALSQAITPTWSGQHTFSFAGASISAISSNTGGQNIIYLQNSGTVATTGTGSFYYAYLANSCTDCGLQFGAQGGASPIGLFYLGTGMTGFRFSNGATNFGDYGITDTTPGWTFARPFTLSSATVKLTGIGTDAATTDNTLCVITATGAVAKGSGTLGICLGTSGRQFKTGFTPMSEGLSELMKINFESWRYLPGYGDGGARLMRGPMAQNVEAAIPDIVGHDSAGAAINYDYGSLFMVGLRAVQQIVEACDSPTAVNDNFCVELKRKLARQ